MNLRRPTSTDAAPGSTHPSVKSNGGSSPSLVSASGVLAFAMLLASGANYLVNLVLARMMEPAAFGDASLMVTSMLALTSLAVGVQLHTAKQVAGLPEEHVTLQGRRLRRKAALLGVFAGAVLAFAAPWLHRTLQTESATPFVVLSLGLPAFLLLSVDRGLLQGEFRFARLAGTYIVEAVLRMVGAIVLVALGAGASGATMGLTLSFLGTALVARVKRERPPESWSAPVVQGATGLGPLSVLLVAQVVINNGDVILSKQLFDPEVAGAYAAVALVGRAVFFASWSIVQAAYPAAVQSDRHDTSIGATATLLVAGFGAACVAGMYIAAPFVAQVLFGEAFSDISVLLGPYAAATALFATANVMATIDVAQQRATTAWMLLTGAFVQTLAIVLFVGSPKSLVTLQVGVMAMLVLAVGSTRMVRWYHGLGKILVARRPDPLFEPCPTTCHDQLPALPRT